MLRHAALSSDEVHDKIEAGEITWAGHQGLKIYGRLECRVGKRYMARVSRVFFSTEDEAILRGFRPCPVCCPRRYAHWRQEQLAITPVAPLRWVAAA